LQVLQIPFPPQDLHTQFQHFCFLTLSPLQCWQVPVPLQAVQLPVPSQRGQFPPLQAVHIESSVSRVRFSQGMDFSQNERNFVSWPNIPLISSSVETAPGNSAFLILDS